MKNLCLISLIFILIITGCGSNSNKNFNSDGTISYMYAKELVINNGAILVDLDTKDVFDSSHIDGSISMPINNISEDSASKNFTDSNNIIIEYSSNGNNDEGISKLKKLGYKNIYDLGKSDNWK